MAALKALVIIMGVMIIAGIAGIGWVIASRMSGDTKPIAGNISLPEGYHIAEITGLGDRLVLRLSTGEPGSNDQLIIIDPAKAKVIGTLTTSPLPAY